MNIKKIGMTALAASLVSVSAHAGEMTISGAASVAVGGYSGEQLNAGTTFSMGNQFTVSGSGELDNGLNIALSFQLDQGASADTSSPFDDHSVTISSDEIGTIKFSGHGVLDDPKHRIGRPRQLYKGEKARDYVPMDKR
jgi:hypothetical protein